MNSLEPGPSSVVDVSRGGILEVVWDVWVWTDVFEITAGSSVVVFEYDVWDDIRVVVVVAEVVFALLVEVVGDSLVEVVVVSG